ncbi:hypothetical protein OfM1_09170 [Lactovum odontotermitis]
MKKSKLTTSLALSVFVLGAAVPVQADTRGAPKDEVPVYRLYNKNTGEHFYTPSAYELISLQKAGWTSEGIGWYAPQTGEPVYRIYNPNAKGGDHYYTKSKFEAEHNVSLGWKWDNDGKPAFYSGGDVANFVAYNPNADSGAHNYTTDMNEQNNLLNLGWKYSSIAWKALKIGTNKINLDQIYNQDLTTIQGLWKNSESRTLEVIGNQFILNGKDMNDGLVVNMWDTASKKDGYVGFTLRGEVAGAAMMILSPGTSAGPNDTSDLSQPRIYIGQSNYLTSYFYKVGS